jgi:hypothetical protein
MLAALLLSLQSSSSAAVTATAAATADHHTAEPDDFGAGPGWHVVAVDTPRRTYLDVVPVSPHGRAWSPELDGWPMLAQWENVSEHGGIRTLQFEPDGGAAPSAQQIAQLLPKTALGRNLSVADAPGCSTKPSPRDAGAQIQCALDAAGREANPHSPVNVIVPPGNWTFGKVLVVPADVRLVGAPGSTLSALDPAHAAVNLAGNRSGALFLTLTSPNAIARLSTPQACGIWVGAASSRTQQKTQDTMVIGNEVVGSAAAHVFAMGEHGGTWAFNFAHDGFADTFHHTGRSSYCQVRGEHHCVGP